ncbi:uncharacterized protein J7T54_007306 [Emericellopsis cladophorae]|uniref:Uncharacterized protein n=1 Tax=Emericellopsis cladophorae TaxID=2686198 RepID=A0A9Q0BCH2_9HYPO|nr:uncharacterized protein J7T54_007306 [Emericellopsis cladophorae]KAI6780827.1 hypothetical protein J7T54_007306 [Emericellopsis cladophorae]
MRAGIVSAFLAASGAAATFDRLPEHLREHVNKHAQVQAQEQDGKKVEEQDPKPQNHKIWFPDAPENHGGHWDLCRNPNHCDPKDPRDSLGGVSFKETEEDLVFDFARKNTSEEVRFEEVEIFMSGNTRNFDNSHRFGTHRNQCGPQDDSFRCRFPFEEVVEGGRQGLCPNSQNESFIFYVKIRSVVKVKEERIELFNKAIRPKQTQIGNSRHHGRAAITKGTKGTKGTGPNDHGFALDDHFKIGYQCCETKCDRYEKEADFHADYKHGEDSNGLDIDEQKAKLGALKEGKHHHHDHAARDVEEAEHCFDNDKDETCCCKTCKPDEPKCEPKCVCKPVVKQECKPVVKQECEIKCVPKCEQECKHKCECKENDHECKHKCDDSCKHECGHECKHECGHECKHSCKHSHKCKHGCKHKHGHKCKHAHQHGHQHKHGHKRAAGAEAGVEAGAKAGAEAGTEASPEKPEDYNFSVDDHFNVGYQCCESKCECYEKEADFHADYKHNEDSNGLDIDEQKAKLAELKEKHAKNGEKKGTGEKKEKDLAPRGGEEEEEAKHCSLCPTGKCWRKPQTPHQKRSYNRPEDFQCEGAFVKAFGRGRNTHRFNELSQSNPDACNVEDGVYHRHSRSDLEVAVKGPITYNDHEFGFFSIALEKKHEHTYLAVKVKVEDVDFFVAEIAVFVDCDGGVDNYKNADAKHPSVCKPDSYPHRHVDEKGIDQFKFEIEDRFRCHGDYFIAIYVKVCVKDGDNCHYRKPAPETKEHQRKNPFANINY